MFFMTCSNYCDNCGNADCDYIREMIKKLAEYEDLEESGRLVKLQCVVGDTVYIISDDNTEIIPFEVVGFNYMIDGLIVKIICNDATFSVGVGVEDVFATKEAAEAKLKEMED